LPVAYCSGVSNGAACELEGLSSAFAGLLPHCALSGLLAQRESEFQSDQPENGQPIETAECRFGDRLPALLSLLDGRPSSNAVPDSWHRTYSADQIAALSKLSSDTIDELVRFGLLDARGGLFGFRDLASARQISSLFANGIGLSEIIRSVKEIRAWLPEADLSNLRLHPATHHAIEIEQPEGRTDKRGQFVLAVNPPEHDPDALFERAQSAEDAGDVAEAERLYRLLMKCDPTDAAPPFNLANMLRANGRNVEAEAAFRAATRADPAFAEAWYNLSDLLDEQGRLDAAVDCLRGALRAAPDYADAMFNLALLLQRSNKHAEAAEYWRRYLAKDGKSEWAARARRSLKFCEMQMHLSAS